MLPSGGHGELITCSGVCVLFCSFRFRCWCSVPRLWESLYMDGK